MKKRNTKRVLVTVLASAMLFSSVAYAAAIQKKQIPATFGKVKVNLDGKDVTPQVQGFISEGSTYMPLRAVSNVLGIGVSWDPSNDTAYLTSPLDNVALLQQQIAARDLEIARLNSEIKKLKDGDSSESGKSIRDIESQLIKDYESYKKASFNIKLSGNSKDMDLRVEIDLGRRSDREAWEDLSERDVERFIESMVDDIQREYKKSDIKGEIRDTDAREDLYTFEKRGDRKIDIESKGGSSSFSSLEKDLKKDYESYFRKTDVRSISLKGDKRDITVKVTIDLKESSDEWDEMADSDITKFFKDVKKDIQREYRDAEVEGELRDRSDRELGTFRRDSFRRK